MSTPLRLLSLALVVALIAVSPAGGFQDGQTVIIDGSKNPELFPEWYVWERAFEWLSADSTNRPFPLEQEIGISKADLAALKEQARAFQELNADMTRRVREARASAKSKSDEDINAATEPVILDYRYKVLDLEQRVRERLSTDGLFHLAAWIDKLVKGSTVRLRGRAIEFFRQPR